ncbi:NINE protein [Nostoc sp. PA-18-2419]|uniref:NINE protein n=1 Tax=Nostoc sp. PA-18-2419 TaxID=2575443 RepID=UPI001CB97231|nr:NINE protein [Nostoc sp. PA-18-2419]
MQQTNSGDTYILWCLCLFGICGGQRFYTAQIGTGLIYLFTVGFFEIGQLIDLALIPGMVEKRNIYLRGLYSNGTPNVNQSVTLNIGEIPQLQQLQAIQSLTQSTVSPMQKLLTAAKEHNG